LRDGARTTYLKTNVPFFARTNEYAQLFRLSELRDLNSIHCGYLYIYISYLYVAAVEISPICEKMNLQVA